MTLKSLIIKIKYSKSLYFYILVTVMGISLLTFYNTKPKIYINKEIIITQPVWQASINLITPLSNVNITNRPSLSAKKFDINKNNIQKHNIIKHNIIKSNLTINNLIKSEKLMIQNESDYLRIEFDRRRISSRLWPKSDSVCGSFRIYFAESNSLPKCGISSFPGSGNTWLRRLIEAATGIFTGSQYDDGSIYLNGYFGELDPWSAGTTIVQKTHMVSEAIIESLNSRGIFIIRNPYKAILSLHNFMFGGHHMFAPIVNYRRKDWPAFVHLQIKNWLQTAINWVSVGKEVLVIHYENLVRDPVRELRKVLKFLRVKPDEERMACIQLNNFREFKRTEEYFPESLEIFSNITRDKMDRAIRYVAFLLMKHGHETPPLNNYEFYNNKLSHKIKVVKCEKEETLIECDSRVDEINTNSRNSINKFQGKTYKFLTGIMKLVTEDPIRKLLQGEAKVSSNRTGSSESINELK